MSLTSPIRRFLLPCLVVAIVCGFSAQVALAAEEQAEPKPKPAVAAPAEEPPDELVTEVFHLRHASGDTVTSAIRQVAPEADVTFDSRLNRLIVVAPAEALGRVQQLVQTLDTAEEVHIRLFRLKYGVGDAMLSLLENLAPDARITVDERSNSLIVAAPKESLSRVEELIETLDLPPDRDHVQSGQFQVYPLQHVDAAAAVRTLQMLMLSPGEPSGPADRVRIDADPKTNRLLVYAPLALHVEIEALLAKLDAPMEPGEGQQVKVFHLMYSDAEIVAETVSGLMQAEDVTISIDPRTNSLIAKGPERTLEVMENLLLRLDEQEEREMGPQPSTTYHVRVVWLASGLPEGTGTEPAEDLGGVLAELAKVSVTGVRQVGQVMVYTLSDGEFQISASPMLDEGPTQMQIDGKLDQRQGTPRLDIRLTGTQITYVPRRPDPLLASDRPKIEHKSLIDLDTEIAAPLGHYVVLGVTPVGNATSVFVVRVTESDPTSRPPKKEDIEDR